LADLVVKASESGDEESDSSKDSGKSDSSDDKKITALESEISNLEDECDLISASYDAAYNIFAPLEKEINEYKKTIDDGLTTVIKSLNQAQYDNDNAIS